MDSSLLETAEAMDGEIPEAMALTLGNVHEELMTLSEASEESSICECYQVLSTSQHISIVS